MEKSRSGGKIWLIGKFYLYSQAILKRVNLITRPNTNLIHNK